MTVYVLEAYNTDSRYPDDVRYREYTSSKKRADLFKRIPKIQFSDSGHGICFWSHEFKKGQRKELRRELLSYVYEQMLILNPPKVHKPNKRIIYDMLKRITEEKCMRHIEGGSIPLEWAISEKTMQEAIAVVKMFDGTYRP